MLQEAAGLILLGSNPKAPAYLVSIKSPRSGQGNKASPRCPLVVEAYPLIAWVDFSNKKAPLCEVEALLTPEVLKALQEDTRFEVVIVELFNG